MTRKTDSSQLVNNQIYFVGQFLTRPSVIALIVNGQSLQKLLFDFRVAPPTSPLCELSEYAPCLSARCYFAKGSLSVRKQPLTRHSKHSQDFRGRPVGKSRQRRLFLEPLEVREVMACNVNLTSTNATLTEPASSTATITDEGTLRVAVTRNTSCVGDVEVHFAFDNTITNAADGSDYWRPSPPWHYASSGNFPTYTIIPASSSYVYLPLKPSFDTNSEPDETIRIRPLLSPFTTPLNNYVDFTIRDNGLNGYTDVTISSVGEPVEGGTQPSGFSVTRDQEGNFGYPLVVNYAVDPASTAISDFDYSAFTGTVEIPANQTEVFIPLQVLDDNVTDGTKSVVLKLQGGSYVSAHHNHP